MPETAPPILEVYSRRFRWTAKDGFTFQSGSETVHGLNRTPEGAQDRIDSHRTRSDDRREAFFATLFDEATRRSLGSVMARFVDGAHLVEGRRYDVREAVIGD
jgi:hypothetical protein